MTIFAGEGIYRCLVALTLSVLATDGSAADEVTVGQQPIICMKPQEVTATDGTRVTIPMPQAALKPIIIRFRVVEGSVEGEIHLAFGNFKFVNMCTGAAGQTCSSLHDSSFTDSERSSADLECIAKWKECVESLTKASLADIKMIRPSCPL